MIIGEAINAEDLVVGGIYDVKHPRYGRFCGRLVVPTDEFGKFIIMAGKPMFGGIIYVKLSLCKFHTISLKKGDFNGEKTRNV